MTKHSLYVADWGLQERAAGHVSTSTPFSTKAGDGEGLRYGEVLLSPTPSIRLQMAEEAPSVKMQTPPSPGTNFNKQGHGKHLLRSTVKHTQQPV